MREAVNLLNGEINMLKATVFFMDSNRGYAAMNATQIFCDDIGAGPMVFIYNGEGLRGVFRLDAIDSVHVNGD